MIIGEASLLKRMKDGEVVCWTLWGGYRYRIGEDSVRQITINNLLRRGG